MPHVPESTALKIKNHGNVSAIAIQTRDLRKGKKNKKLSCFDHRADALGAQRLLGLAAFFIYGNGLQIGKEFAVRSP